MIAVFVQKGDAVDYTPTSDVAAGAIVVVGELVGVAKQAIPADKLGSLALVGVYDVPKLVGDGLEIMFGDVCFWDATNQQATESDGSGANKRMGHCVRYAGDTEETVRIRFSR